MPVEIRVEPCYSTISFSEDCSSEERVVVSETVRATLSWTERVFVHPGAVGPDKYEDFVKCLLTRDSFPSGLLVDVVQALRSRGCKVVIRDERRYEAEGKTLSAASDMLEGIALRDYQLDAIRRGVERKNGVYALLPGTGKTEIAIGLVRTLNLYPVVWLTHTTNLLRQTVARFRDRLPDISVGQVGDGKRDPLASVNVCMVQSLLPDDPVIREAKVLLIDECHHTAADSFYNLAMTCPAVYRYGFSATPLSRTDGADIRLLGAVGSLIYELPAEEAIRLNVLTLPRIRFVRYCKEESKNCLKGVEDWKLLYRHGIEMSDERNNAVLSVCQEAVKKGRIVLVLVARIRHGEYLAKYMSDWIGVGGLVEYIRGWTPGSERDRAIKRLQEGKCRVLVSTQILDEGVDVPDIDVVVIAGGGKSAIKNIQRVGRGMRKGSERKRDLLVFDFLDEQCWILQNHSKRRRKDYESLGALESSIIDLKGLPDAI